MTDGMNDGTSASNNTAAEAENNRYLTILLPPSSSTSKIYCRRLNVARPRLSRKIETVICHSIKSTSPTTIKLSTTETNTVFTFASPNSWEPKPWWSSKSQVESTRKLMLSSLVWWLRTLAISCQEGKIATSPTVSPVLRERRRFKLYKPHHLSAKWLLAGLCHSGGKFRVTG